VKWLIFKSWLLLLYLDFYVRFRSFGGLLRFVRDQKVQTPLAENRIATERLCRAVDLACVFYFKKVMCLQRSAATVVILRRYGWAAEMVIGAELYPFRSHAWVESEGRIVNDRPYVLDVYRVLERC
jgi:hypothetical protein